MRSTLTTAAAAGPASAADRVSCTLRETSMHRASITLLLLASTATGQSLVRDINKVPYPLESHSHPSDFATLGTIGLFAANDIIHGRELWRSDGT